MSFVWDPSTWETTATAPQPTAGTTVTAPQPTADPKQFVNTETGRTAYTGPNGEGALAAHDPRVKTMSGLVAWQQPNGVISYYIPNQNIQQGNIGALEAWQAANTAKPTEPDPALPLAPIPTLDYRAEAAARYPWLTGALLNEYANAWSDTGSPTAALSKLRQSAEYKQVFQGIFREDGTMRMDENSYFSTKVGYREALAEFGRNPAQYESLFVRMIENEMDASEFVRGAAEAYQRFIEPGASNDNGLFDQFLGGFIDSGSAVEALQRVRESDAYANVFVGNRREDGTLRMDETEWFAYKRGWSRTLAGFGLNPEEFMARDRLRESVEGEVSIQELNQRLQITQDGILDNVDAIKQFYARGYGVDVSAEAILGMAIDPDIQRDVLERRITAAQVGGEASLQGFIRTVDRAEQLARMGVTQSQARDLYGNAAQRLPGLSATTRRFNLGDTGIGDFEQAIVGQDAFQMQRFGRAMQREQSSFSSAADTRRDQGGGLTGLRQR